MPSLTVVQVSNTLPTESELKAIFEGAGMRALTDMIAKDMGDTMRGNMLKRGGPGGDWPKLSGFNVAKEKRKEERAKKKAERDAQRPERERIKREREYAREARRERADQRRARRLGDEG